MSEGTTQGKKTKRSTKNQPANRKYLDREGWKKNKSRKVVNDLYRRVILFCRKENVKALKKNSIETRMDLKRDIKADVHPTIFGTKEVVWNNSHIARWAELLIT
jgi:hypothetical protein